MNIMKDTNISTIRFSENQGAEEWPENISSTHKNQGSEQSRVLTLHED